MFREGLRREIGASFADVEFAGDDIEDETGAVLAEEVDLILYLSEGSVLGRRFVNQVSRNRPLFLDRREADFVVSKRLLGDPKEGRTSSVHLHIVLKLSCQHEVEHELRIISGSMILCQWAE